MNTEIAQIRFANTQREEGINMARNIEQLIKLVADYHNFCLDDAYAKQNRLDFEELNEDELDQVAAAAGQFDRKMDDQE